MSNTPTTAAGLRKFDRWPAIEAVAHAWNDAGSNPAHHHRMRAEVARSMPLLARALDRLAKERDDD